MTLANELSRNGRRSGLTFAPEGGSERIRRVINKTVSKEDLVRTVTTAYANGWRQVKLYFMCGLPTETDEDVLEIAELAVEVIRAGREASGTKDVRCTVSIGGFVPKPHTPFQWAGQASAETIDHRLRILREAINADRRIGRSIGLRYHDGKPGVIEGLLSRGDRRVGRVIERVWRDGGHFDGWSEHFSYERWTTAATEELGRFGLDLDWFTTRERTEHEVLPWDHLDSGLDKEWLWEDWQDAVSEDEVGDCRWTGCYDCGVCPTMGTEIQIGPTGRSLLPAHRGALMARQPDGPPPPPTVQKLRLRYTKRGPLRFASHRDLARALERALRRAAGADGVLGRVQPAPEDLLHGRRADRRGVARRSTSRSGWPRAVTPSRCGRHWTPRCRRASTSWSASRRSRAAARSPTGWTPPAGGSTCPGSTPASCPPPSRRFLGRETVLVDEADQERHQGRRRAGGRGPRGGGR